MPNVPSHLDIPRFAHGWQNIEDWIDTFHKTLQRQWTMLIQAYNALVKIDTAANMPSVPYLDEIIFYEQDTGRSYVAVSGNWQHLAPWSGRTVSANAGYTMQGNDAVVLGSASSSTSITITILNGASYTSRIRCIKKVDSSVQSVFVLPSSGTIDGAASRNLSSQYQAVIFTSDGTDLHVVSTS